MNDKKEQYWKCKGDYGKTNSNHRSEYDNSSKMSEKSNSSLINGKVEPVKISMKSLESNYVTQIVSIGIRSDSIYEAQMLLAPEVDMSSIKITVKNSNLRVTLRKPLNDELKKQLVEKVEKSPFGDLIRKFAKHCVNLLIPETIDGDKVRAIVNNRKRLLILTAPMMKASKAKKKYMEQN